MSEETVDVIFVLFFWGCIAGLIFCAGMGLETWRSCKYIDQLEERLHVAQNRIDELEELGEDDYVGI